MRWTEEEIEYLRSNAGKVPVKEIAVKLHRSRDAVATKMSQMNILCRTQTKSLDRDLLHDMYHVKNMSIPAIAIELNINKATLYSIFKRLNIKSRTYEECASLIDWSKAKTPKSNRYNEISGRYWSRIKSGANDRNIIFSISIEYAWSLFVGQNRKCALSGQDIALVMKAKESSSQTASLDRIDSSKGYVEGNVQWIHKDLQSMKMDKDEQHFIDLCKLVTNYRSST